MKRIPDDEFYIGYVPRTPRAQGAFLRGIARSLLAGAVALAVVLASAQGPLPAGTFEYGHPRDLTGRVRLAPYPTLLVARPGASSRADAVSSYLLVGEGKHGANLEMSGLDGAAVRLSGTLIYRDGHTMVQVAHGSVRRLAGGAEPGPAARGTIASTEIRLRGEIVDSKCHLGVMVPSTGAPHRACAVRCISGGVPPMLVVRGGESPGYYLVVGPDGRPLGRELLAFVAQPVEVTGLIETRGGQLLFRTSPAHIRRLS